MMHQGGLGQGFEGDAGTAAEFDGQSSSPSAMCLLNRIVEAHRNTTIWHHARLRIKVQSRD
jgi:hypothetical protein